VHGFVIPKEGPDKGRRLHHAWIEVGKFIIETQGGMRQKRSKKEYYNTFSVEVERVYSVEEARSLVDTHKIYGAWNQIK